VTLEAASEAASRDGIRGRLLAQLEHNAMLALGMVRASSAALQGVSRTLDRANRLIGQVHGPIDLLLAKELRAAFDELSRQVHMASHDGHKLLQGGSVSYALDDPWLESSQPLQVALPDLSASVLAEGGLDELELGGPHSTSLPVLRCMNEVRAAIQAGQAGLQRATRQLNEVLARLHGDRIRSAARGRDDDFEQLAQLMREHVLRSGASALRVQGPPSSRAASLVEGSEELL
jgi:hypothetical protein